MNRKKITMNWLIGGKNYNDFTTLTSRYIYKMYYSSLLQPRNKENGCIIAYV